MNIYVFLEGFNRKRIKRDVMVFHVYSEIMGFKDFSIFPKEISDNKLPNSIKSNSYETNKRDP